MARHTIALIAHDGKKAEMVAFSKDNASLLSKYTLVATGTTGRLIREKAALDVECMQSGPLGGDAQIAAMVVEGEISAVFFFIDPLGKHPHDPDINMLLRICNVHNVPLATNESSAMCIMAAIEIANNPVGELSHLQKLLSRFSPEI
jgi:methylglyoxal synthase